MALLWLLVGISAVLLLLTPFCVQFPRLGCGVVRVEVPWRCRWHCRAWPCSKLSQLLPAAGLCPVGAGRGAWCYVGVADGCRADCKHLCPCCRRERLDLAPTAWDRRGDRQWVHEGSLRVMEQPRPQSLFDAQSRACLVVVMVPAIPTGNSCLSVCPPQWVLEALEGVILVLGLPRPAGIHRVTHVHSGGC